MAGTAMEHKVVNDAVAYIRGLAELRGRNAEWAESAVRGAASLQASAALAQNVIDLIAPDPAALLAQLDGREVHIGQQARKLATGHLGLVTTRPDWRTQLLAVITHPTVAYGLLLIGIYGLLFEGYNPGAVLPGVAGAVSLLIALFAFQILSVNWAGLALIVLGVGLIVAEFFMPAFGSLGVGGLIAFVMGSVMLFDSDVPGLSIGWPLIAGLATAGGLLLMGMVYLTTRSLLRPVVTGTQGMVGEHAVVTEALGGADAAQEGRVRYGGELWNAVSSAALPQGQKVRIVKVEGLTLHVEALTEAAGAEAAEAAAPTR
jgi:membrane-bound serine protease (ClpP class)